MNNSCFVCLDIGTSWAKVGLFTYDNENPVLILCEKIPSGAGKFDGSYKSIEKFIDLCANLQLILHNLFDRYKIESIGLTGIREGIVLVDEDVNPLWVSGNLILENRLSLNHSLQCIEHVCPIAGLLSLQGYLAYLLSGSLAITWSEIDGLDLNTDEIERINQDSKWKIVNAGSPIGLCTTHSSTSVYLAGTDEQAALLGARLGHNSNIVLATGSYWSMSAKMDKYYNELPPYIRILRQNGPYCQAMSLIGYKWGIYLNKLLVDRQFPSVSTILPNWAIGQFIRWLSDVDSDKYKSPNKEKIIDLISIDIKESINTLAKHGSLSTSANIIVHGGSVHHQLSFLQEVMAKIGHPWSILDVDATLMGCLLSFDH